MSDAQVRKLMEEMSKHGQIGQAAMKADMDRKTARKYVAAGKIPSELKQPRDWRTRPDPFDEHWPEVEAQLRVTPEFEAKTLFELLQQQHPGRYEDGQLRTLQRHVKRWRAAHGPDREVVLAQQHRPGEAAQTDFTHATELAVTIAGQLFMHLLCVLVLPYSNWQWATVCLSESMLALRKGVQRALFQLGRVPRYHQTDGSTAATHKIPEGQAEHVEGNQRAFNAEYVALMRHLGMTPRVIEPGEKEQNGDVEAANGAIKRRLEQALLVRGSRDFESVDAWQAFIDETLRKANANRGRRVAEDLAAMRELDVAKLPEYIEEDVQVSEWSTVRVKHCAYSVPSRLMGEWVRVRIFEDRLEVRFADEIQLACERLRGRNLHRIDYRHVIWSLVRKPGGFARYVYREEMFPSLVFREAYDAIQAARPGTKGDLEYLRILHLAASTMEADVAAALAQLQTAGTPITVDAVKALTAPAAAVAVPALAAMPVDLTEYDALLDAQEAA
ncbi:MAG TPA: IS21 family transposase [Gemmatimonadaceae bacterium]|nr:IS21 family transposase [Gemmatimonadaceae bacterium]